MGIKSMTIDERAKEVTVVLSLEPHLSSTGKMTLLATTNGWAKTPEGYDGKPVLAAINIGVSVK